ncbi:putative sulfate exporter family transporter [Nocardioides sp. LHD-245]|uniref:YeiH family protein n=1 Tax=Nocardioides sp. LHD-245 TaxID=3051387 RepID=UPI0027E0657E|nr:putative sulfate exporter family transporter [Nocardioides sp. LHD-245]
MSTTQLSKSGTQGLVTRLMALLPPASAASLAVVISTFFPLAGPLLIALVLGAVVANTGLAALPAMSGQARVTKTLLRVGVVMLGLKLPVQGVFSIGWSGVAVIVVTVAATYSATLLVGDRLKLDRGFVTLLAAGFSICGAAAIAAVDDAVKAKQRYVALALALVTIFGSAMIVLVPWLAAVFGLSQRQAALWAGASIHEVAQVVAAASLIGGAAIAVATTVKLGRVVLLAPLYAAASRRGERADDQRGPLVPWFVAGFAVAVAVRSMAVLPSGVLTITDAVTTFLLAAGMFGLGLGIRASEIWPLPLNAFVLASFSTLVAGGVSLGLVVTLT